MCLYASYGLPKSLSIVLNHNNVLYFLPCVVRLYLCIYEKNSLLNLNYVVFWLKKKNPQNLLCLDLFPNGII